MNLIVRWLLIQRQDINSLRISKKIIQKHHAFKKPKPQDDIGPPWRYGGILLVLTAVGLFVHEVLVGHKIDREFVILCIACLVGGLGLIRPAFIDNLVKAVASKIPGFSFGSGRDKDGV